MWNKIAIPTLILLQVISKPNGLITITGHTFHLVPSIGSLSIFSIISQGCQNAFRKAAQLAQASKAIVQENTKIVCSGTTKYTVNSSHTNALHSN